MSAFVMDISIHLLNRDICVWIDISIFMHIPIFDTDIDGKLFGVLPI